MSLYNGCQRNNVFVVTKKGRAGTSKQVLFLFVLFFKVGEYLALKKVIQADSFVWKQACVSKRHLFIFEKFIRVIFPTFS